MKWTQKINNYLYYILIGVVSFIGIAIMPLIGSEVNLALAFPNTVGGWIVYVGANLISAVGNMLIFFSFMEQAKINIKDNEHFQKADKLLLDLAIRKEKKEKLPRSPKQWKTYEYSRKGVTLFLGSLFSCVALGNAILHFDVMVMLGYIITTTFAVIFGLIQMKHSEKYWTDEYYRYALYEEKKFKYEEEQEAIQEQEAAALPQENMEVNNQND